MVPGTMVVFASSAGGEPEREAGREAAVVEGEALLHMEELGNYTLKYLARRRTRKPPHDLVTGQTPDYMLSN